MNKQQYLTLLEYAGKTPLRKKLVVWLCKLSPIAIFLLYIYASVYLAFSLMLSGFYPAYTLFWLVPAAGLILVSIFRRIKNAPRPYEVFGFTPLISHEKGGSFPSRHTASAFLITCALFWLSRLFILPFSVSLLCLFFAAVTAASRIAVGVHFPKDIVAGMVFSVIFSVLCYSFLPPLFPDYIAVAVSFSF